MGCDIHVYIELSRDGGKTWVADQGHEPHRDSHSGENWYPSASSCGRNYELFGVLAGVRGGGCVYDPRDLPHNISEPVAKAAEGWEGDAHTHSWLTLSEFEKCLRMIGYKEADFASAEPIAFYDYRTYMNRWDEVPHWSNLISYCRKAVTDLAAEHMLLGDSNKPMCRLVFWFDN